MFSGFGVSFRDSIYECVHNVVHGVIGMRWLLSHLKSTGDLKG